MALSIGVSVGDKIDINGHLLRVKSLMQDPNVIIITIDGGPEFLVTDKDQQEILPNVKVQLGIGRTGGNNRLAFDAPRTIPIHRLDGKYR